MTHPTPNKIKTDRLRYVPVIKGARRLSSSARTEKEAIENIEHVVGMNWSRLKEYGFTIEKYWESEYE